MSTQEEVAAVIAPLAGADGLILDGVEISQAGKRRLLRVTLDTAPVLDEAGWIDQPTPPVGLDDVAAVSRRIDAALDGTDLLGGAPYVLEVSSPGVGRPLRQARHFQRNVGRLVAARTADGEVTGRIRRAGPSEVVLALTDPAPGGDAEQTIPYAAIDRASVVVEFGASEDRS